MPDCTDAPVLRQDTRRSAYDHEALDADAEEAEAGGRGAGGRGRGRGRGTRTKDKWDPTAIGFDSEEHQFHAGFPTCWKRYGGNKQRWAPPMPADSEAEAFTVRYTERKCKIPECPAGLRVL